MAEETNEEPVDSTDDSLAEGAQKEKAYLRARLRAELGRDPSDEELNDWLRQHTEGY